MPPQTIDGPNIPVTISPVDEIETLQFSIDVWRFQIESIGCNNDQYFDVSFSQIGSVVDVTIERIADDSPFNAIHLSLRPTYTEPSFDPDAKPFGQFEIISAQAQLMDGSGLASLDLVHGSWVVTNDSMWTGVSATVLSPDASEPLPGVAVQLVGLADTPVLFPIADENLKTDNDGYALLAPLPRFDVQSLAGDDGLPVWMWLDFPLDSPYRSGIYEILHQGTGLDVTILAEEKSSAESWSLYR